MADVALLPDRRGIIKTGEGVEREGKGLQGKIRGDWGVLGRGEKCLRKDWRSKKPRKEATKTRLQKAQSQGYSRRENKDPY